MITLGPSSNIQRALLETWPLTRRWTSSCLRRCTCINTEFQARSQRLHHGVSWHSRQTTTSQSSQSCPPITYESTRGQPIQPQRHSQSIRSTLRKRQCLAQVFVVIRGYTTTSPLRKQPDRPAPHSSSSSSASEPQSTPPKRPLEALRAVTAHENIYTLPNFLTFTRLLAGPGLAYLIMHDQHLWTLGLFAYAGLTDLLDGWIARRWNQKTVVGTVVDPMADKTLMTAVTLALAAQARLPLPLAVVILGRDALLGLAALYYRWISLPPPKTMARYWDFSLPSAEVHPTGISKVNTALQLALIGAMVAMPVIPPAFVETWSLDAGLVGLQWVVGATTIWSGLSYVWSKDAVKILGKEAETDTKSSQGGNASFRDGKGKL